MEWLYRSDPEAWVSQDLILSQLFPTGEEKTPGTDLSTI
jgi:hypothetical protein